MFQRYFYEILWKWVICNALPSFWIIPLVKCIIFYEKLDSNGWVNGKPFRFGEIRSIQFATSIVLSTWVQRDLPFGTMKMTTTKRTSTFQLVSLTRLSSLMTPCRKNRWAINWWLCQKDGRMSQYPRWMFRSFKISKIHSDWSTNIWCDSFFGCQMNMLKHPRFFS